MVSTMSALPPNQAKKLTVLLIDDEVDICAAWSMVLEMEGMTVLTAPNGLDGLMKAKSCRPDVVICDFMMPGINGLEVCAAIRAEDALQKASIVLWSAARGIDGKGLADLVVEKPVDTEQFIEHIHAVALRGRS
ncbi:two component LuxR family transcriptional regulator [Caballeronia fortuita]|uniref:Two component LuxR family transcriptional regulator n=2 Tax=Caballeronia fortuita TaxID=1777138 RepID=A0A157ZB19_9BURK|nr:two component LuxR family transcriptional regulator [Caballeronia fortuita]